MLLNTSSSTSNTSMIHSDITTAATATADKSRQQQCNEESISIERVIPLPSVLIDFMAMTLCDLVPMRRKFQHNIISKEETAERRCQSLSNFPLLLRLNNNTTTMPELIYFIQKITFQVGIHCRTALVALIYLNRAKHHLPRGATAGHDTSHRMFLASILLASKFLQQSKSTTWMISTTADIPSHWSHYPHYCHKLVNGPLTNKKLSDICGNGLFPLNEINQLERAFLKLIQYQCWVND